MLEQKDFAAIILVVALSFTASFFIAGYFINTPEDRSETVLDVNEISTETPSPDPRIFHDLAVDPKEEISIGESSSENPFTGGDD